MLIGITGTNGAGKGAVVEYLVQKKGFAHYSMRDLIVEEIQNRGLEVNRVNMGAVGTDLRKIHGPSYFTDTFIARAGAAGQTDIVMESVRTLAEAENIRKHGGFTVGVDAPEQIRYARIIARKSPTDHVSFEQFREQEDAEYRPLDPTDPTQMNVLGVLATADYTLMNDGTFEEFQAKIEEMLTSLARR